MASVTTNGTKALIDRAIAIAMEGCVGPFDENCHEYPHEIDQWCAACVLEDLAKALEAPEAKERS